MSADQIDQEVLVRNQICKLGQEVLRRNSEDINFAEIGREKLTGIISAMRETLIAAKGVGIAAPQVGVNLRLFITEMPSHLESRYYDYTPDELRVWINPKCTTVEEHWIGGLEGCLSVPGYVGRVMRPSSIIVQAFNEKGDQFTQKFSGWNARIILHEYDHLDGILYIDKVAENSAGQKELFESSIWQMLEAERRKTGDAGWLERYGLRI